MESTSMKMILRTCRVLIERLSRSLSTISQHQQPSQTVPIEVFNKQLLHHPVSPPHSSHLTNAEHERNIIKNHSIPHKNDDPKPIKCKLCDYSAKYSSQLKYHIQSHTGEKPYSCHFCKKGLTSNATKKRHEIICKLNPKHSDPNWIKMQKTIKCTYCDYGTLTKGHLKEHLLTHTAYEYRPFPCALCSFRGASSSSLADHIRTHTRERPFECPTCEYRAATTSRLHQHIKVCHNERNRQKFHCKTCPKSYFTKWNLNLHMMTHTGERPHSCQFCQRGFIEKSYKNSHQNICKMNPRPAKNKLKCFNCTNTACEFSAATRRQVKIHSVKHLTVKLFKCEVCNKSFKCKSHVNGHMHTHRTEKPYECNLCNNKFSTQTSRDNHIRNHVGEKPHTCQFCTKCFVVLQGKKVHENICKLNPNK